MGSRQFHGIIQEWYYYYLLYKIEYINSLMFPPLIKSHMCDDLLSHVLIIMKLINLVPRERGGGAKIRPWVQCWKRIRVYCSIFVGQQGYFLYNKQNNTYRVEQDISLVRFANSLDILVNT